MITPFIMPMAPCDYVDYDTILRDARCRDYYAPYFRRHGAAARRYRAACCACRYARDAYCLCRAVRECAIASRMMRAKSVSRFRCHVCHYCAPRRFIALPLARVVCAAAVLLAPYAIRHIDVAIAALPEYFRAAADVSCYTCRHAAGCCRLPYASAKSEILADHMRRRLLMIIC